MKKSILFLGNSSLVIFKFRKELIEHFRDLGYELYVSFPSGPFGDGEEIAKTFGCKFFETPIDRRGRNPLHDLRLLISYHRIIKAIKPDIVLAFTVKPDIYGGLVCRWQNIAFVANITGLGKGLAEEGATKHLLCSLYRIALKKAKCVFFQNEADQAFFLRNKIKLRYQECLPGSGVNLQEYNVLDYPSDEKIIFTYVARVMKTKGIDEYLQAAEVLGRKYENIEFHICGFCEEDYQAILDEKVRRGEIIYHGLVSDVIPYLEQSHCVVLPSFHPEGISNVLLEGAACGRPLITTNRPGCRETVDDGNSGYLVKEQDVADLIDKMEQFIHLTNEQRRQMGLRGRKWIEKRFDRKIIVEAYNRIVISSNI